ncbi:MAG: PQQ-dependent sugar dehydrogenase [Ilumatobacteraceae bacterium]
MRRPTSTSTFGARVLARVTVTLATAVLVSCGAQPAGAPAPIAGDPPRGDDTISATRPSPGIDTGSSDDYSNVTLVAVGTLDQVVDAASRAGDAATYFVSRTGTIHRFVDGTFAPDAVLDVSDLTEGDGERGLLGLAFSGDGATAYINYTDRSGDTIIASLSVDSRGAFNRDSLRTILTVEQPFRNHNAGDIVVEPSGMLLVPMGDGGSANDPLRVSLDDSSPLGKVLRVDPRNGSMTMLAKGLRNPWRVDLHDDRLWLADVGQSQWEEVSVLDGVSQWRGVPLSGSRSATSTDQDTTATDVADFGWSAYEANDRFNTDQSSPSHIGPVVAYQHGDDGCSVSGGAVAVSGALQGRYVFADYCSGRVWSIATDTASPTMTLHFDGLDSPSAVVRANDDLFVLSLSGTIWKLDE